MKAKIMDASHLLIILSEQEALRLGLNSISVDIPTTLSKITLAKVFLEGCKYTGLLWKIIFTKKKVSDKRNHRPICVSISKLYRHDGCGGTTLYGRHYLSESETITFWR